jgi:translation initiation factor IF-3
MSKILANVEELAKIDMEPRLEGNNMTMMLSSNNKNIAK